MSPLFVTLLTLHVLIGVIGVIASFVVCYQLIRVPLKRCVLTASALTAFISYLLSWFFGGWYYWHYYGAAGSVRDVIKAGDYSWAHYIIMEAKEHVFLFLPFAALSLYILLKFNLDGLDTYTELRKRTFTLALIIALVGTIITLSGILISGGAQ